MSKQEIKTTVYTCDICQNEIDGEPKHELFTHTTGYSGMGGSAIGVSIVAKPFGDYREHACKKCNKAALFAASQTLPEWLHLQRCKSLIKDLLIWYENGNRDHKDLDRIRDAASDLCGPL